MIPKLAGPRMGRAPAFVAVGILLGITPAFAESITFANSGLFSLTDLTPISFSELSVAPTPPTASFSVATAGYFVIDSAVTLTGGSLNSTAKWDSSLIPPSIFGTGSTSTWTAPATVFTAPAVVVTTFDSIPGTMGPAPAPVPEPSTVWLVGLGLVLLVIRSHVRNHVVRPH